MRIGNNYYNFKSTVLSTVFEKVFGKNLYVGSKTRYIVPELKSEYNPFLPYFENLLFEKGIKNIFYPKF